LEKAKAIASSIKGDFYYISNGYHGKIRSHNILEVVALCLS